MTDKLPPDYTPATDGELEIATRAGAAALAALQGRGNGHEASAVDEGWAPFVDVLSLDASRAVPEPRIPYFGWAHRITIVSGEPKAGKSTALSQAIVAALTGTEFAGIVVPQPVSVAIATEEDPEIVKARLCAHGLLSPDHDGLVWVSPPREGVARLLAAVERQRADVFVIDSLTEWALHNKSESMNDALAMRALVSDLRRIAKSGTAVIVVHHGRKADGEIRDSVDLAAAPDLLIFFEAVGPDGRPAHFRASHLRRLSAVGRWPVDTITLGFRATRYYVTSCAPDGA